MYAPCFLILLSRFPEGLHTRRLGRRIHDSISQVRDSFNNRQIQGTDEERERLLEPESEGPDSEPEPEPDGDVSRLRAARRGAGMPPRQAHGAFARRAVPHWQVPPENIL